MKTLLVSDIHLGEVNCQAKALLSLLKSIEFDTLILIGDIFSSLNFGRLNKEQFRLLNHLRKLSNPRLGKKVIWIEGNHDIGLIDILSSLMGITVYRVYQWIWNGKRCVAIHGHQFDHVILDNFRVSKAISFLVVELQRMSLFWRKLAIWLSRVSTKWSRVAKEVEAGAFRYAKRHKADIIFCGHTHINTQEEKEGIKYFNTGSWNSPDCGYILMTDDEIVPGFVQAPVAHMDRAFASEAEGNQFKSGQVHHITKGSP